MALSSKMPIMIDGSIQVVQTPPTALSIDLNEPKSFSIVFEEHMPSSRKPISHDSASVLLLSYDSSEKHFTDFDARDEVEQLEEVFRNDYGFDVQQQLIKNNKNAQLQMFTHLSNFTLDHGKEHGLLIVYYAGHGWHSNDKRRDNPGRFDLRPKKLHRREHSSGDELVMWEVSETILHHVKGDVLVIFDCCDAGSLAKLRSGGRAFEYLGACDKYTHFPGKRSFTSALTWALKEMSSKPPFTTDQLVSKIKAHESFPDNQNPVLFPRWDFMPEHIWISSTRMLKTSTLNRRRSSSVPEFRDENCDYVDFRVTFSRPLGDEDGQAVAELMSPLVCNRNSLLSARHVACIKKGTCKPSANPTALWTRARNHVVALNRFQGFLDSSPTQKRKRHSFDAELDELDDCSRTKCAKPSSIWDGDRSAHFTTLSPGEYPDSSSEGMLSLQVDTTIVPTRVIFQSADEMEIDPINRFKALLKELEKLKQDALHQPELHRFLQSQIHAALAIETK